MADTYLREKIALALKAKMETISRPDYHMTPSVEMVPEELPDLPPTTSCLFIALGEEEKRQDLAAQRNVCTLSVSVTAVDTDYTNQMERRNELSGDIERAAGSELSITDAESVTLPVPIWVKMVDPWSWNGQLIVTVHFDVVYDHRMGDPARF